MFDTTPHLERFESYEQACREFRWRTPEQFNIATAISRRHKDSITRTVLKDVRPGGINTYTFGGVDFLSDKFASLLAGAGVRQGDAVAVIGEQSAALLVAQFGALKLGAVVVPLSPSMPAHLLQRALKESRARAVVSGEPAAETISIEGEAEKDFWRELNYASSDFTAADTSSDSPAFVFFKQRQNGSLAGIVHAHRSLIGQLTAFETCSNDSLDDETVFWTASDWATPQTLLGLIYPAMWYGCSIAAQDSLAPLAQCEVTNAFIPSFETGLPNQTESKLRAVLTTPRAFTQEIADYVSGRLGATLSAVYGTTETGLIATGGAWVRAAPGHSIEVLDERGLLCPAGLRGRVAVRRPDPALFLRYADGCEDAVPASVEGWFVTDDEGHKNKDGELSVSPSSEEIVRIRYSPTITDDHS